MVTSLRDTWADSGLWRQPEHRLPQSWLLRVQGEREVFVPVVQGQAGHVMVKKPEPNVVESQLLRFTSK